MKHRVDRNGNVFVTLSRRNLLTLLHKLDKPGSARELMLFSPIYGALSVKAEEDAEHYADRTPGPMTEDTEAFIAARQAQQPATPEAPARVTHLPGVDLSDVPRVL